jgi:acetoacetate decarboxylase
LLPHNCGIQREYTVADGLMMDRRRQQPPIDAADQSVVSAGPYRFFNREYFVITTGPIQTRSPPVPEPLEVTGRWST